MPATVIQGNCSGPLVQHSVDGKSVFNNPRPIHRNGTKGNRPRLLRIQASGSAMPRGSLGWPVVIESSASTALNSSSFNDACKSPLCCEDAGALNTHRPATNSPTAINVNGVRETRVASILFNTNTRYYQSSPTSNKSLPAKFRCLPGLKLLPKIDPRVDSARLNRCG